MHLLHPQRIQDGGFKLYLHQSYEIVCQQNV